MNPHVSKAVSSRQGRLQVSKYWSYDGHSPDHSLGTTSLAPMASWFLDRLRTGLGLESLDVSRTNFCAVLPLRPPSAVTEYVSMLALLSSSPMSHDR